MEAEWFASTLRKSENCKILFCLGEASLYFKELYENTHIKKSTLSVRLNELLLQKFVQVTIKDGKRAYTLTSVGKKLVELLYKEFEFVFINEEEERKIYWDILKKKSAELKVSPDLYETLPLSIEDTRTGEIIKSTKEIDVSAKAESKKLIKQVKELALEKWIEKISNHFRSR